MEHLNEIITKSLKGRLGHIEGLLFNNSIEDSLFKRLYEGIANEEFADDEEARKVLYGESENSSKYKMLKKRFFERLASAVLLVQPKVEQSSLFLKNQYYCHKYIMVARLLIFFTAARKTGVMLLKKALKKALETEQYDIVQISALMLRQQSVYSGNEKEAADYNEIFTKAIKIVRAEAFAEEQYQNFIIQYTRSRSKKLYLIDSIVRTAKIVERLSKRYKTYQLHLYSFRMNALACEMTGDFENLLKYSKEHEEYLLRHKQFYSIVRHANILHFVISAYLQANNYEECIKTINRALHLTADNSPNWFSIQEMHFLVLLNMGRVEKAGEVYLTVSENPQLNSLHAHTQEIWKILGGYLWFLLKLNNKEDYISRIFPKKDKFRFSTFLNDLPIYSRDKQGLYVSVLILQILLLLLEKENFSITDRIEALRVYLYRRLKDTSDYRTREYVKMLQFLEKYNYDAIALAKKTPVLIKTLQQKAALVHSDLQLEVLRYEKQWEIIIELCAKANK